MYYFNGRPIEILADSRRGDLVTVRYTDEKGAPTFAVSIYELTNRQGRRVF
jgi:hypothetical protein